LNVLVGSIARQLRGVSYAKLDARNEPRQGYLPILRANNITDEGLTFSDLVYIPAERISKIQRLQLGDVVIAASSGSLDVVGKAGEVRQNFDGGFGAFCKVLRPNATAVDPIYFSHYFRTQAYRQRISSLAAGANINNLKNEHLDGLEIPLPPLDEQRRTAAILDKADALRRRRKRSLDLLDDLTQSIFLEMFGDPEKNPKGWKRGRISDLLEETQYGTSEKAGAVGKYPILRMGNITSDGRTDFEDLKYIDLSDKDLDKFTLRRGDILFNRTNSADLVGKTAVFDRDERFAFAGYLVRARARKGVSPHYV
jgi:type I restriction enzyme, S subunit